MATLLIRKRNKVLRVRKSPTIPRPKKNSKNILVVKPRILRVRKKK